MLLLNRGREIPALKRALPIFEEILAKKNLHLVPLDILGEAIALSQARENTLPIDDDALASPRGQVIERALSHWEPSEDNPLPEADFLLPTPPTHRPCE